jgi:hypothetical protein
MLRYEALGSSPHTRDMGLAPRYLDDIASFDSVIGSRFEEITTIGLRNLWFWPRCASATSNDNESSSNASDLPSVYHYLVSCILMQLPRDNSDQGSAANEMVVRQVSADLYLSGLALAPPASSSAVHNILAPSSAPNSDLPVRNKSGQPGDQERKRESTEEANGLSFTRLSTTQLNPPLTSQDVPMIDVDEGTSRLAVYTTVKPLPALPKKMANILAHWNLSQDPRFYDWGRIEAELDRPDAEERAAQAKAQARIRKRKEQDIELPGRLTHVSDELAPTKKRVATQGLPPVLASSQVVDEPVASTHTERAILGSGEAFGKRAEKARKKRKDGF